MDHVKAVWTAAKYFLKAVADHVADDASSNALISELIIPALDILREVLKERTIELLLPHQKGHPITYNHYFTVTLQQIRNERQEDGIRRIVQEFFNVDSLKPYRLDATYGLRSLVNSLMRCREPNMTLYASDEALDCTLAYYKVALKRFIDDVACEIVEIKLMLSLHDVLSPVSVYKSVIELYAPYGLELGSASGVEESLEVLSLSGLSKDSDERDCDTPERTTMGYDAPSQLDGYPEPMESSHSRKKKKKKVLKPVQ
ncbi:hypothetical protein AtubIFM54640_010729 [Aspergillus tubingensis]|nr:hypothetical protein AtubIFM54640_010729 [Aspergillus tubingensis]